MAVKRSTNGKKWRADYYVLTRHPVTGAPYRKRERKDFDTKKEAALWAASHALKPVGRLNRDLSSVRFIQDAIDYYLGLSKILTTTQSTQRKYRYRLNYFLQWCTERRLMLLNEVTRDVAEAYTSHIVTTFSGKGIDHRLVLVNSVFITELRRENSTIRSNPFADIRKTGYAEEKEVSYLDPKLIEFMRSVITPFELAVNNVLYSTGIRGSEFSRMEWVNVLDDQLVIPKSKNGRPRVVPLNSKAREAFAFFRDLTGGKQYVLFGDRPASPKYCTNKFDRLRRKLSKRFPEMDFSKVKPHALRRSLASHALQRGARIEDVSAVLGHTNVRITQRYYATVNLENKKSVTDLID